MSCPVCQHCQAIEKRASAPPKPPSNTCKLCGEGFYVPPSQAVTRQYCSQKCAHRVMTGDTGEDLPRNTKIWLMRADGATMAEIAYQVGISNDRVRQIIEAADRRILRQLRRGYGDDGIMLPMPSRRTRDRHDRP